MENRAKYMTICISRWLGLRLDLFGNTLVLGIALFAAGFRTSVDPSKIGVVFSYTLNGMCLLCIELYQAHSCISNHVLLWVTRYHVESYHFDLLVAEMINQFTQIEQSMNAVERVLHYTDLPEEAAAVTQNDPPSSWPDKGEIKFTDVAMRYRENLPLVLDDVNFHIRPGEKASPSYLSG
jgi:ATP-binding cassette, subfamily C (CFTR/MRP), member 1